MKRRKQKTELDRETLIKYATLGGGLLFIVLSFIAIIILKNQQLGVVLLLFAVAVGVVPYGIYNYFKYQRFSEMEKNFPNFLRDFAEAKKSGMTFPQAFKLIAKGDYGALTPELKKASNQLSWGVSFPKVMNMLMNRVKGSNIMRRAFVIINEAYQSGGDVADTMDSIATNINTIKEIEAEKKSTLSQQVVIMYFIFFLFLGIVVALYKLMIPMLDIQSSVGSNTLGIGGAAPQNYCFVAPPVTDTLCAFCPVLGFGGMNDQLCYFKILFLFMGLIQAIGSGVLAGEIGGGSLSAGVNHMLIMGVSALIVFLIFF